MDRRSLRRLCSFARPALLVAALAFAAAPVVAAPSPLTGQAVSGTWVPLFPFFGPPGKRFGAACADDPTHREMWLFGGNDGVSSHNDLWVRDLAGNGLWTPVSPLGTPPGVRLDASLVFDAANDRLVLFGGVSGPTIENDVWALDLAGTPTWIPLTPAGTPPQGRYTHDAAYDPVRQRMIVFGGNSLSGLLNDAWALDLSTPATAWNALTPAGPSPAPRSQHSLVYDPVGDRMVLFGGLGSIAGETAHPLGDTWTLDLAGAGTWTQQAPAGTPPVARRAHRSAYDPTGARMIVVGGSDGGSTLGDIWALDLAGSMTWNALSPSLGVIPVRSEHAMVLDAPTNRLVMFGGRGSSAVLGDEVTLSLAPGPNTPGAPTARLLHKSALDAAHQDMIVFGGWQNGTWFNDVYALHLAPTPTWSQIRPVGAVAPVRSDHVQVVDSGNERMIVFGGKDASQTFNDTWQLTLGASPTWSQLSPTGTIPTKRQAAAGVYDPIGHQMFVFGGISDASVPLNDLKTLSLLGFLTWSPMPTGLTPPPARYGHSMIYDATRQQLVVFGGATNGFTFFNDVWIYDINGTRAWSHVTPAGTPPTGRYGHEAAYDGARDRMVVFGGYDGAYHNDIWELKLGATPTWTQLAPDGPAPAVRDFPTAVLDAPNERWVFFGGNSPKPDPADFPQGDTFELLWDLPVPVLASLVDATAGPGTARLTWQTPDGAGVPASVERTADGGTWETRARIVSDGSGLWTFTDAIEAGGRYGYRLVFGPTRQPTAVTWLDVPAATALRPGLAGAWPNPSRTAPTLSFTLAAGASGPAVLEVFDVAGRSVFRRDVATLGPGPHALDLRGAITGRAGVYLATLRAGGSVTTRKFAVLP